MDELRLIPMGRAIFGAIRAIVYRLELRDGGATVAVVPAGRDVEIAVSGVGPGITDGRGGMERHFAVADCVIDDYIGWRWREILPEAT